MIFFLSLILLFFDLGSPNTQTVFYDSIEYNIVNKTNNSPRFRQLVFWKDGCSQGYVIIGKGELIHGPVKNGPYYEVIVQYYKKRYILKAKNFSRSITNYDVEINDLKLNKKERIYDVRKW